MLFFSFIKCPQCQKIKPVKKRKTTKEEVLLWCKECQVEFTFERLAIKDESSYHQSLYRQGRKPTHEEEDLVKTYEIKKRYLYLAAGILGLSFALSGLPNPFSSLKTTVVNKIFSSAQKSNEDSPPYYQTIDTDKERWLKEFEQLKSQGKFIPQANLSAYFNEDELAGFPLQTLFLGEFSFPSGNIIADDFSVFSYNPTPYLITIPPGQYPVELALLQEDNEYFSYAALRIQIQKEKVAYYELGLTGEEDLTYLRDGKGEYSYRGYEVLSSMMTITDQEVAKAYEHFVHEWAALNPSDQPLTPEILLAALENSEPVIKKLAPIKKDLAKKLKENPDALYIGGNEPELRFFDEVVLATWPARYNKIPEKYPGGDWINLALPLDYHLITVTSGWGAGYYPLYFGFNAQDEVVEVITLFIDIEEGRKKGYL